MKKLFVAILSLAMLFLASISAADNPPSNAPPKQPIKTKPQNKNHSIDLTKAKQTVNNVVNAGAVKPSTNTVQGAPLNVTTPPKGSIPGSGGKPWKSNPPPPPSK